MVNKFFSCLERITAISIHENENENEKVNEIIVSNNLGCY